MITLLRAERRLQRPANVQKMDVAYVTTKTDKLFNSGPQFKYYNPYPNIPDPHILQEQPQIQNMQQKQICIEVCTRGTR